jgi:hypothetical protein
MTSHTYLLFQSQRLMMMMSVETHIFRPVVDTSFNTCKLTCRVVVVVAVVAVVICVAW